MSQTKFRIRQLKELADHPNKQYRLAAVEHCECPPDLLQMLSDDQWNKIREAVASHPDCPLETLRKLAQDRNVKVRGQVAAHPKCPPTQLAMLALDEFERVRKAVARNPNCPSQSQSRLHKEFGRQYCTSEFVCGSQQAAGSARLYQVVHPLRELKRWADEGDPEAQLYLAEAYEYGREIPKDHDRAIKWYVKAAEQGIADAQYQLGLMYESGNNVKRDTKEALKWYRKAAEQGIAHAQCALGEAFETGVGVRQDYNEALKWYWRAYELGSGLAAMNLGFAFQYGQGVLQDFEKAQTMYLEYLASEDALDGSGFVELQLGHMLRNDANPNKDNEQAYSYYRQAAEKDLVAGRLAVGEMLLDGAEGVDFDYASALDWYQRSAT